MIGEVDTSKNNRTRKMMKNDENDEKNDEKNC